MKNNYHQFFCELWSLSDDLIAMCGIKEHITDIYLASILDFVSDNKKAVKILKKIQKKYHIRKYWPFVEDTPIALLALSILEHQCSCTKKKKQ
jgi:hypothetical protein